jgi:hypothetical protein
MPEHDDEDSPPRSRRTWVWGLVIVVVAALVAAPFIFGNRLESLTDESLAAARDLWDKAGPDDYDMDVVVSGAQSGRYEVSVRDGKLERLWRDGRPADPAAGEYWTVPGLFRTLEEEMEYARSEAAKGSVERTILLARFDPQDGHPVQFMRHVAGTQRSVRIEVESLE